MSRRDSANRNAQYLEQLQKEFKDFRKDEVKDLFTEKSKNALISEAFKVTTKADRMGYRLEGYKLELAHPLEMISEGATLGTIQAPPDGNPIILLADHQSVAGYPKIGQVCIVDVARVAQYKPGDTIRFEMISSEEAEELYIAKEKYMENVKIAVKGKL